MTLSKDNNKGKGVAGRSGDQPQNRTQKIVMWSILGVAAVMAIIAIVLFVASGARFF